MDNSNQTGIDRFGQYQHYANNRTANHAPSTTSATSGQPFIANIQPEVFANQADLMNSLLRQLHHLKDVAKLGRELDLANFQKLVEANKDLLVQIPVPIAEQFDANNEPFEWQENPIEDRGGLFQQQTTFLNQLQESVAEASTLAEQQIAAEAKKWEQTVKQDLDQFKAKENEYNQKLKEHIMATQPVAQVRPVGQPQVPRPFGVAGTGLPKTSSGMSSLVSGGPARTASGMPPLGKPLGASTGASGFGRIIGSDPLGGSVGVLGQTSMQNLVMPGQKPGQTKMGAVPSNPSSTGLLGSSQNQLSRPAQPQTHPPW